MHRFPKSFQQLHGHPTSYPGDPQPTDWESLWESKVQSGGNYISNQLVHWEKMTFKQLTDFTHTTPCFTPTNKIKTLIDTILIISQFTQSWLLVYNTIKSPSGTRTHLLRVHLLLQIASMDIVGSNIIKITFRTKIHEYDQWEGKQLLKKHWEIIRWIQTALWFSGQWRDDKKKVLPIKNTDPPPNIHMGIHTPDRHLLLPPSCLISTHPFLAPVCLRPHATGFVKSPFNNLLSQSITKLHIVIYSTN